MLILDSEGLIMQANPACLKLLNYEPGELDGKPVSELLAGHRERVWPKISRLSKRSVQIGDNQKVRLCRKGGAEFSGSLQITKLTADGAYYAGIVHSKEATLTVSEIALSLQKEKELNQRKSSFVSMASHEFRTPLSSIQLSASLIEHYFDRLDRAKIFKHLQQISTAVADMTGTLNDLLSLEKMEAINFQPAYQQLQLAGFCKEIIAQVEPILKNGQSIILHPSEDGAVVITDPNLLRHCLVNLLTNAAKYSPEDSVITLLIGASSNHYWLKVTDQGIGIPITEQARLFEPFFRAGNVGDIPGTGLGLSIVRKCAGLLNGTITFKSQVGIGTIFDLYYPQPSLLKKN